MYAAADRLEFAPPATPGQMRALLLAILAHGLLVMALAWGVQWKREAPITPAEAELWASVPQEAAPRLQELPPEPVVPAEVPKPAPKPVPAPEPVVQPPKVDIALEQEKRRIQKQKQLALEKQQEKLKLEKQQEKLKLEKLQAEKLKAEKLKADKLKQELADKTKLAQEKKASEQRARQLQAQREKNLQRMAGLAGASGGPSASGTALKSAGPSASYQGIVNGKIRPNIIFPEDIADNPRTEVEVRTSPDGTIISKKITRSSGNTAWDAAVLRAFERLAVMPRDTDGHVPSPLIIGLRPKD